LLILYGVGSAEIRMEQWWHDTDRGTEASEINLSLSYFVHHKFHIVPLAKINTVEPGYNDIGLNDTSSIATDIL
jgi:hypothetical protein